MSDALRRGLIEASRQRADAPQNWRWPSRIAAALAEPGGWSRLLLAVLAGATCIASEVLAVAACIVVFVVIRAAVLNPLSGAALWFVLVVGALLGAAVARQQACDGCSERNRCGPGCPDYVPPVR